MATVTMQHKAADGIRTHDLVLTKDALYQLSYSSQAVLGMARVQLSCLYPI